MKTDADRHQRPLPAAPTATAGCSVRDDTGRVFVRHEANLASGGTVTDFEVAEFLSRGGLGPEKQELLRLIGSLADYKVTPSDSPA